MPTDVTMLLTPQRKTPPPSWTDVHWLACRLIGEAPYEHRSSRPKRWSAAIAPNGHQTRYALRVLDDGRQVNTPPPQLQLGRDLYTVTDVETSDIAFAGLIGRPPARAVQMLHLSPATLDLSSIPGRDGTRGPKRYLPLPEPVTVYRGLAARWNDNAPHQFRLTDPLIDELLARIALARHDISTQVAHTSGGALPGFVGQVRYSLAGPDRDHGQARRAFTALSAFAALCGVGAQTSHGLGSVDVSFVETAH